MKLTAGPHSDPEKSLATGHAAHIHAASPKGPRYNTNQSPSQRKSILNGLWLCRECGDIVDKDTSPHPAARLKRWKTDHEAMISEVRKAGYSRSLELLQARRLHPQIAKRIISQLEERRAIWESFDAEFPDRVRQSLDSLREKLLDLRSELPNGDPLDETIQSLTRTILSFFKQMEKIDMRTLTCNSHDPEWTHFRDTLLSLRKSIGLQVANLAEAYGIRIGSDLKSITPKNC